MSYVMVVDDDTELCEIFQQILEHAGYQVNLAHSASQAIDLLPHVKPDVLLLDIHLVKSSGTVVLAYVRRHPYLKKTKVVIITGDAASAQEAQNFWEADQVLVKPISSALLRETVAAYLG